jgi:TRAP-type mannitol/chloroaromatic compound transport system permease small subunit
LCGERQNLIDRLSEGTGRLVSWMTLAMVILMFVIVVMRYIFDVGLIWLQESVIWMHATVFMVGAAYTLKHEAHVRVDVFYGSMNARRQAWVNALGVLLFLLPMCGFLAVKSFDFAITSWSMQEASRESGGLPYPVLPLVKSVLVIMPLTVGLQGLSLLFRSISCLRGR